MTLQTIHFLIGLRGTKAEIEAVTGIQQGGRLGYATDTDELGTYDGATWHWQALGESSNAYTPLDVNDWDYLADPGNVDDALDQLADRVKSIENTPPSGVTDAADLTYTPAVVADWNGSADPGDADQAFDQLAERVKDLEGAGTAAPDYILLQDQKAQNTAGGGFTSGADQTRVLNTEVVDNGNHCSLSSNQFTLAAGTYEINAIAPGQQCGGHQAWLYNVTDGQAEPGCRGTSAGISTSAGLNTHSHIRGRFTIASQKTFEIRHRCTATRNTDGFGFASNLGTEIYTVVELHKVA